MPAPRGSHRTRQHKERASVAPPRTLPRLLLGQLRMAMYLGVGDTFIEQPSVHLVVGFESQPRCEEALTNQPDLIFHLTSPSLMPAYRQPDR